MNNRLGARLSKQLPELPLPVLSPPVNSPSPFPNKPATRLHRLERGMKTLREEATAVPATLGTAPCTPTATEGGFVVVNWAATTAPGNDRAADHTTVRSPDDTGLSSPSQRRQLTRRLREMIGKSMKLLRRTRPTEDVSHRINVHHSVYVDGIRVANLSEAFPSAGNQDAIMEEADVDGDNINLLLPTRVRAITRSIMEEQDAPRGLGLAFVHSTHGSPSCRSHRERDNHVAQEHTEETSGIRLHRPTPLYSSIGEDAQLHNDNHFRSEFLLQLLQEIRSRDANPPTPPHSTDKSLLGEEEHDDPEMEVGSSQAEEPSTPPCNTLAYEGSPWEAINFLGCGTSGEVFLVEHKVERKVVAMKILSLQKDRSPESQRLIINELKVLKVLRESDTPLDFVLYPISVQQKWAWRSPRGYLHVLFPYCPGGDLYYRIQKARNARDEDYLRLIAAELVLGIESLHELGIVHHDLKPENIVIDADGHCRIADFGSAKIAPPSGRLSEATTGGLSITEQYAAPELLAIFVGGDKYKEYTDAVDWWALGATLLVLALDAHILHDEELRLKPARSYRKAVKESLRYRYSSEFIAFILHLLQWDPEHRPTFQQIRRDPFFDGLRVLRDEPIDEMWEHIAAKRFAPFKRRGMYRPDGGWYIKQQGAWDDFVRLLEAEGVTLTEDASCDPLVLRQMVPVTTPN